ncbi:MAG: helix-turn-helix transcriptional regulator [Oscillospiraceae bacterium]|nr:helix-turn-helix transcriptional regulator [Oscillospiraceae bacterium]
MDIMRKFRPTVAIPVFDGTYSEIKPCPELAPYICCFWTSAGDSRSLVIPDTCMDLIFRIDHVKRSADVDFCTVDERGYRTEPRGLSADRYSIFGIRFYAWTAVLFTDCGFSDCHDQSAGELFSGLYDEAEPLFYENRSTAEITERVSELLLSRLDRDRSDSTIMNSVRVIIDTNSVISTAELAERSAVSRRQLERIFMRNIGVSPKSFTSLMRYQMLWQDICGGNRDFLALTEKYGFCDQAHMINDFRKRHTMSPGQALELINKSHFYNTNKT